MTRKTISLIIYVMLLFPVAGMAQDQLPVPSSPGSWVNDYAGVFSQAEVSRLDQKTEWL